MSKIKKFSDLNVWQEANELVKFVYAFTDSFPKEETYVHTAQLRRAAISVTGNIAEGFGRYHYMENTHFLRIARGSVQEMRSHMLTAHNLHLINKEDLEIAEEKIELILKMINKMIKVTNNKVKETVI